MKARDALAALLREMEEIDGLEWIRLLYAYPTGVSDFLIETIAAGEKVVRYLDIPLQHVSDEILKAMRRPDTKDNLRRLIEKIRSKMSDIVLRTTLIVGFPGETDAAFAELVEFVQWAGFDALGAFPFYPETGTPAADFPDQVPDPVKQQRLEELMLAQQEIAFAKNRERVGSRLVCLVDSLDNRGRGWGRFYGQAPDIDGVCTIKGCSAAPGQFVATNVVGAHDYDLVVKQV
jgi:ribosomal protein S12 methylthiotransferase